MQKDSTERVSFGGIVRDFAPGDTVALYPILSTWIVDRATKEPLQEEVIKDLKVMIESAREGNGQNIPSSRKSNG